MRIAAYLSVKDEAEIIERTIAHLRAIGVDAIVAVDMHSTDGTYEILDRCRSDDLTLLRMRDDQLVTQEEWSARQIEIARSTRADWVLFLDADEFWLPASGSLKTCRGLKTADVITVDRFNIVMGLDGAMAPPRLTAANYADLLIFVQPIPNFREYLLDNPDTPWIRGVPMAKVMIRPERAKGLTAGDHDIVAADEASLRRHRSLDLVIAHLPFTTPDRFARKVENVRKVFTVHDEFFAGDMAWHWRRWLALADRCAMDAEFRRQTLEPAQIAAFRETGVIRSASEVFAERMNAAVDVS